MRAYEKMNLYAELKSHFTMLQASAKNEYECHVAMRAALDPDDEDERHELTFRADRCCADMLRYERALIYIEELQEREEMNA